MLPWLASPFLKEIQERQLKEDSSLKYRLQSILRSQDKLELELTITSSIKKAQDQQKTNTHTYGLIMQKQYFNGQEDIMLLYQNISNIFEYYLKNKQNYTVHKNGTIDFHYEIKGAMKSIMKSRVVTLNKLYTNGYQNSQLQHAQLSCQSSFFSGLFIHNNLSQNGTHYNQKFQPVSSQNKKVQGQAMTICCLPGNILMSNKQLRIKYFQNLPVDAAPGQNLLSANQIKSMNQLPPSKQPQTLFKPIQNVQQSKQVDSSIKTWNPFDSKNAESIPVLTKIQKKKLFNKLDKK